MTYASTIEVPGSPVPVDEDIQDRLVPVQANFGSHHLLWLDCLQKVADGKILRLMGLMPPGSAKSTYSSVVFPTYYMGRFPRSSVIVTSYGSDLPKKFGRKARSIVRQPIYQRIFGTELSEESAAVDSWALTNGSEFMAAGILSGITGNRVDGIIWDDLIRGREAADSLVQRNKTWDAYLDDLKTRKKPNAWEIGINCLVGDTQVSMADGSQKYLRDICPGDRILSYVDGKIVSSKVLKWRNNGPDSVFTIKTKSGISVTANARHPFLIGRNGRIEWRRVQDISVGDHVLKVIGESGGASNAKNAINQLKPGDFATITTVSGDGEKVFDHLLSTIRRNVTAICGIVTGLISEITKICLRIREGCVPFVSVPHLLIPQGGMESCVLTIATPPAKFVDSFATIATTLSEKKSLRSGFCPLLSTFEDPIVSIVPDGREDVFDIQVETETFIANGLVSHNTRWHEDDPAGRILPEFYHGESGFIRCRDGNEWYVVCIPAIAETDDDILGRREGERLWPEYFPPDHFDQYRGNARTWNALYQQRPAPESGDFFQADWLVPYDKMPDRDTLHVYGASDYAVSTDKGDFTVHIVVGIDPNDHIYILDLWRKQTSADVWVETMTDLVKRWKPMGWAEETGQIRSGVGPFLVKRLAERQLYIARAQFPTKGDKSIRAQSIRGRIATNKLYYPRNAAWFPAFKHELMTFPAGKHDDQVDALGLIGQILDKMVRGDRKDAGQPKIKVLSTNPAECTVTLEDCFEANEQKSKSKSLRIR